MTRPDAARCRKAYLKFRNAALIRRSSLLIWLGKYMMWLNPSAGRNGRPPLFSNAATQLCLIIKLLLLLRQTTGWWRVSCRWPSWTGPVRDFFTLGSVPIDFSGRV